MSECFTANIVERRCHCGEKCRPRQRNCHACHAKAQSVFRERRKIELEQLRLKHLERMAAEREIG